MSGFYFQCTDDAAAGGPEVFFARVALHAAARNLGAAERRLRAAVGLPGEATAGMVLGVALGRSETNARVRAVLDVYERAGGEVLAARVALAELLGG